MAALKAVDVNNNQHSVSAFPDYTSSTDLHAQGVDLYHSGTPFSGVSTDIDNDSRNSSTPCIGADEFTPPAIDMGLNGLIYPFESSCGYSSTDSIVVEVKNMGLNTLNFASSNATIVVYINGIINDSITYVLNTGSLATGNVLDVKIANSYNLSLNGKYSFNGNVSILNDGNALNDAMTQVDIINYPNINSFPFSENFESGQNLSFKETHFSQSNVGVSSAAANVSTTGLHFQGGSSLGWNNSSIVTQAFNNTSHTSSAMSCNVDATSNTALYLQFNLRQTKYSTYNNTSSWFRVLLIDANNNTHYLKNFNGDSVFQPTTANADPFLKQIYDLSTYIGQNFQISFEASCRYAYGYSSYDGDNAYVDDIEIWVPSPVDVAVKTIWSDHLFGAPGKNMTINTTFANMGTDTLYSVPLAYQVNNGAIIRDTAIGTFLPFQTDSFAFGTNYILASGLQTLCVFAELANDGESSNDTACALLNGLSTYTVNYSDDYETKNDWFTEGSITQWQLGTPNSSYFSTAHSGQNAWTTVLSGNHNTGSIDYLYSPYLIIPTYADTASLEFWMTMNVNMPNAYGLMEYSFDGILWMAVGYIGDPTSTNWYNQALNGKHVWSLINSPWAKSSIKLDPSVFNSGLPFQIRFNFNSGTNPISRDGWAIDDFKITIPPMTTDAGVVMVHSPIDSTITGNTITVSVEIKNFGTDTLTNMPIVYSIDGTVISTEYWSGTLLYDSTETFTFTTTYIASGNDYQLCTYTDLNNDMVSFNDETCIQVIAGPGDQDAGISSIITPAGQSSIGQATTVKIMIRNYGTDTLYSVPVEYLLNSLSMASETFTGTIPPNDSADYTFVTTYTSGVGVYSICANTLLLNDVNASNDQSCVTVVGTAISTSTGDQFMLAQNQPNPANNTTEILFYLPHSGMITFQLVNMLGTTLESQELIYSQGKHKIILDTKKYPVGVYYYSMSFDGQKKTFKMIVVR